MLNRIGKAFTRSEYPSAIIVAGTFDSWISILHLIPEDGTTERVEFRPRSPTFRYAGATEYSREQIGTAMLYQENGDSTFTFFNDVEARVRKLWDDDTTTTTTSLVSAETKVASVETTELVQRFLKPATLGAIHDREGRPRNSSSSNDAKPHPVFIIYVKRKKPGQIISDKFTSIAH